MSKPLRTALIWSAIVIAAIGMAMLLSGCGHYEPPGQDLWRAL